MREHWRTKKDGRRVRVDSRAANSYFDGYNAAKRWAKDKITKSQVSMVAYCVGAGIIIGLLLAYLVK